MASEPIAILNGEKIPFSALSVPVSDAGFVLGATVTEQVRTFGGKLFRLEDHIVRLRRSMEILDVRLPFSDDDLMGMANELVETNWRLVDDDDDLGLSIFVTPGGYATLDPANSPPRLAMHTYALPFHLWADKFALGQRLRLVETRQVPGECWPTELKCRSRMHYYLADLEARKGDPGSRALLLDTEGFVAEASTASLLIYRRGEGLLAPPPEKILPGISVAVVQELAKSMGIGFGHRELTSADVLSADEAILSSTSVCMQPVCRLNGQTIGPSGDGPFVPGPIFETLFAGWDRLTGIDVRDQAVRRASYPARPDNLA